MKILLNDWKEYQTGYNVNWLFGGDMYLFEFPNGYGASVVRHGGSYGYKQGLWELAVLKHGNLCYDTYITDDVIGYLSLEDVNGYLLEIKALEDCNEEEH